MSFYIYVISNSNSRFGAIDKATEVLTPLGVKMTHIPLHPQLSKMLILSCIFKCVEPILSIVSVLNEKDPFVLQNYGQRGKLDQARQHFAKNDSSDHLMYANVVYGWEKAYDSGTSSDFCRYGFRPQYILT